MNALLASKACDVTGKVAIACAQHGCYAPGALVDLYHGEQQKNIDFAFLEVLKSTKVHPDQGVLCIYDIACQYFIHLKERISDKLPNGMEIDRAIGLFHVHAHKDECFFCYATSFIPGTGIVTREILEPLWAELNTILPAVRTATLAYRSEILSDHASDSNHKKALGMTKYLIKKFDKAQERHLECQAALDWLSERISEEHLQKWQGEILEAESKCIDDVSVMDIYIPEVASSREAQVGASLKSSMLHRPRTMIQTYFDFALVIKQNQWVQNYLPTHSYCIGDIPLDMS